MARPTIASPCSSTGKRISPVPFKVVRNERNSGSPFGQWAKGLTLAAFAISSGSPKATIAHRRISSSACFPISPIDGWRSPMRSCGSSEPGAMACRQLSLLHRQHQPSEMARRLCRGRSRRDRSGPRHQEHDPQCERGGVPPRGARPPYPVDRVVSVLWRLVGLHPVPAGWADRLSPGGSQYHRQSAGSVTDVGDEQSAMLAEALRIKSVLWRSPGLSDRGRVRGSFSC